MLPTAPFFKQCIEDMGLNDSDEIVVYVRGGSIISRYDTHGLFSATRAWWMFRVFNRNAKVYVLNGGLPRWLAEKRPLESGNGYDTKQKGSFYVKPDYSLVCTFDEVMDLINAYKKGECSMTVIDTRPKGRFDGVVPERRPGLTCGHMPGSVNIPFSSVVDPEKNFQFRSKEELRQLFESHGVDIQRKEPIVFS